MCDSVPSARYSHVCNVLRQWRIWLPTRKKKHFKNEQRSRDAAAKKRANTSGVGKIINYCEDIYISIYLYIVRISIYLLTTTPINHTYTL